MSVNSNKIDVTLTAEQVAAIMAALDALDAALPFTVSLTPEERRALFRMGTRSEGFVREALIAAEQHVEHVPPSIGVVDMQRDLALRDTLQPVLVRVRALHTKVNDTWLLAGADAMQKATAVYRVFKNTRGHGLDDTINVLRQRFERSGTVTPEEPPTEPVIG
jgi:hypothetical protein